MNNIINYIKNRENNNIILCVVICLIFILELPFLFIKFPPATDISQHIAQMYLLFQTISSNSDVYIINWLSPNTLIYYVMLIFWFITTPVLCGKITLMLIVILWVTSIFFLAKSFNRPFENGVISSLLIFNLSLYWGFFNFLIGWPFFVIWVVYLSKGKETKINWITLFIILLLLYFSHALWFLVACTWLFIYTLIKKFRFKSIIFYYSIVIPISIFALIWFSYLSSYRSITTDTAPHWFIPPIERLAPSYIVDSMLGGIKGNLEPMITVFIIIWLLLSVLTNLKDFKTNVNTTLFKCFVFLLIIVLFAPEKYMNTIYFSSRWLPCAMILLILSFPKPKFQSVVLNTISFFIVITFSVATGKIWQDFEKKELSGLEYSLNHIKDKSSVLGLDFMKNSSYIKGRPFLQLFAYAQAYKEAEINFSFASHSSGIVSYKNIPIFPWNSGLEWMAENVDEKDFRYFDFVLINGGNLTHNIFSKQTFLEPITNQGRWRLYKILKNKKYIIKF